MPRRRESSLLDEIFETLKVTPVWVGPVLAVVIVLVVAVALPALMPARGSMDGGALLRPWWF